MTATTTRDVLLLGLSQSEGMGFGTNGQPYPGDFAPAGNVLIWNRSTAVFETYVPGVNSDGVANGPFFGAEASFAIERAKVYPTPLYIVKRAIPGVGLKRTPTDDPGTPFGTDSWSAYDTGKEFTTFIGDIGAALQTLINQNIQPVIKDVLIVGQETDTRFANDAAAVQFELDHAIWSLRAMTNSPLMRAIIAVVRTGAPNSTYTSTVQAGQKIVGAYPGNAFVTRDDLAITVGIPGDPGHLTPASQVTLGQRMFAASQAIRSFPSFPALPTVSQVPITANGLPMASNWGQYFSALDNSLRKLRA